MLDYFIKVSFEILIEVTSGNWFCVIYSLLTEMKETSTYSFLIVSQAYIKTVGSICICQL